MDRRGSRESEFISINQSRSNIYHPRRTYFSSLQTIKHTQLQYWENDELLHENESTAFAETTHFQLKIGGWDASSVPDQIMYFDDIILTAVSNASQETNISPFFSIKHILTYPIPNKNR
ncbi:MAG: hypothetical protein R6U21_07840 [Thermoplasmatota archaeon]